MKYVYQPLQSEWEKDEYSEWIENHQITHMEGLRWWYLQTDNEKEHEEDKEDLPLTGREQHVCQSQYASYADVARD